MAQWHKSLAWTKDTYGADGFDRARLLRDDGDASHFVSLSEWHGRAVIQTWSDDVEMQRLRSDLEAMCDDVLVPLRTGRKGRLSHRHMTRD